MDGSLSLIEACPSSALQISLKGGEDEQNTDSDEISTRISKDDLYAVEKVESEAEFNTAGARPKEYILCRCGQSRSTPICDGTLHDVEWSDRSVQGASSLFAPPGTTPDCPYGRTGGQGRQSREGQEQPKLGRAPKRLFHAVLQRVGRQAALNLCPNYSLAVRPAFETLQAIEAQAIF